MRDHGFVSDRLDHAKVVWNGRWYVVVYKRLEYARFSNVEKKCAQDFANGFNAGLSRAR